MASIAATANGLGTSDTMPSTFNAPCCCRTFAIPSAVTSSQQRDRSVSMITLGPVARVAVAPVVGAPVVEGPLCVADFDEPGPHAVRPIAAINATTMDASPRCPRRPIVVIAPIVAATRHQPPRSGAGARAVGGDRIGRMTQVTLDDRLAALVGQPIGDTGASRRPAPVGG